MFLVQKKDRSYRVVQDFRSLNAKTYVDKYSMKGVQNWTRWIDYLYYTGPPFRILANGLRPKVKALHSIHGAKHGTIRVESGIYGSNFSPLRFSASG
jgi:hypothetical protein